MGSGVSARSARAPKAWRVGAAAALAAVGCAIGVPTALAETTTIGASALTPSLAPPTVSSGQSIPVFQGASGSGYVVRSPHAGTITSWSFLSAGIATGKHFLLRVLEPIGAEAKTWRAVASSAAVAVTSETGVDAVNGPFATSLPVAAGDAIALQPTDDISVPSEEGVFGVDGIRYFLTPFSDGATAELAPGQRSEQRTAGAGPGDRRIRNRRRNANA